MFSEEQCTQHSSWGGDTTLSASIRSHFGMCARMAARPRHAFFSIYNSVVPAPSGSTIQTFFSGRASAADRGRGGQSFLWCKGRTSSMWSPFSQGKQTLEAALLLGAPGLQREPQKDSGVFWLRITFSSSSKCHRSSHD